MFVLRCDLKACKLSILKTGQVHMPVKNMLSTVRNS